MGVLDALKRGGIPDKRSWDASTLENPSVNLVSALIGMTDATSDSGAGVAVTPERAMKVQAFFACVRLLSNTIASLDMLTFERAGTVRSQHLGDPRTDLLLRSPNPDQTPFDLKLYIMTCLCVWGNAYVWMETDVNGQPIALWPIAPYNIEPAKAPDGKRGWIIKANNQQTFCYSDEVMVFHGMGLDTGKGMAPYRLARQALGLSIAAEDYAGRTFQNDSRPGGVLASEKMITDDQWKIFQARWKAGHEGLKNTHKIGMLPPGVTYTSVDWNPAPYQHVEAREFEVMEMARLFGIPLHYLGVANGATTYASVEAQSIDFVTYTLMPYLTLISQVIQKFMFAMPADIATGVFVEFDVQPLMRADSVARAKVYAVQRMWSIKTVNEIREAEGYPPVPGGDILWMPVNMAPLGPDGKFLEAPPAVLPPQGTAPIDGMPVLPTEEPNQ